MKGFYFPSASRLSRIQIGAAEFHPRPFRPHSLRATGKGPANLECPSHSRVACKPSRGESCSATSRNTKACELRRAEPFGRHKKWEIAPGLPAGWRWCWEVEPSLHVRIAGVNRVHAVNNEVIAVDFRRDIGPMVRDQTPSLPFEKIVGCPSRIHLRAPLVWARGAAAIRNVT